MSRRTRLIQRGSRLMQEYADAMDALAPDMTGEQIRWAELECPSLRAKREEAVRCQKAAENLAELSSKTRVLMWVSFIIFWGSIGVLIWVGFAKLL